MTQSAIRSLGGNENACFWGLKVWFVCLFVCLFFFVGGGGGGSCYFGLAFDTSPLLIVCFVENCFNKSAQNSLRTEFLF